MTTSFCAAWTGLDWLGLANLQGRVLIVFHFLSYCSIVRVPCINHSSSTGFFVTLTISGHFVEDLVSKYKLEFEALGYHALSQWRLLLVFHFISYFSIFLVPDIIHCSNTGFLVTLTIVGHIVEGLVSNYKLEFEDEEDFETDILDTNCAGATVTLKELGDLEVELRSRHKRGAYGPHLDAEGIFLTEVFRRRKLVEDSELRREIAALPHILLVLRRLDQLKGPSGAAGQSGGASGTSRAIPLHVINEKGVEAVELTLKERETGRSPKTAEGDPQFETTATLLKKHIQLQMRGRRDLTPSTDPEVMDMDRALLVAQDLDLEDVPTYLGTPSFVENKAKIQVVVRHRQHVMGPRTIRDIQRALTCILQDIFGVVHRRSPKLEIESLMEVVPSTPFDEDALALGQQPPLAPAGLQQAPAVPAAPAAPAIAAPPAVPAALIAPAAVPPAQNHVAQNGAAQGQVNAALQNVPPAAVNGAAAQNPWPAAQGVAPPPGGLPVGFLMAVTVVPVNVQALLPAPGTDQTLWMGAQGSAQDPGIPATDHAGLQLDTGAAAQGPAVGMDAREDQEQGPTEAVSSSELDLQEVVQCTPFHGDAQQPSPAPAGLQQVPPALASLPQPPQNLGRAPNSQSTPAAPSAMSFATQTAWHAPLSQAASGPEPIAWRPTQDPAQDPGLPATEPGHDAPNAGLPADPAGVLQDVGVAARPGMPMPAAEPLQVAASAASPATDPADLPQATSAAVQSPAVREEAGQEHEHEHEQEHQQQQDQAVAVAAAAALELTHDPEGVLLSPAEAPHPFVDLSPPAPSPDPGMNSDVNVWATEPRQPLLTFMWPGHGHG